MEIPCSPEKPKKPVCLQARPALNMEKQLIELIGLYTRRWGGAKS